MYLIDGHNLIGSGRVPGINLQQEDDEWRLTQWLRARQPRLRQAIVVVFDSGIPGGWSRALSGGGVTVIFASQQRNRADHVIYERVQRELVRTETTVVTNDTVLREAVASLGAKTTKVDEFMALVEKRAKRKPKARAQRQQAEPKLPKAEVEEWLALFEENK
jgi:predicted RNA-binding protein with PIN domain